MARKCLPFRLNYTVTMKLTQHSIHPVLAQYRTGMTRHSLGCTVYYLPLDTQFLSAFILALLPFRPN